MTKPAETFTVTSSYLMWVGAEHYGTIEDYAGEVVKQGVSKRLSNIHMAKKLMEPGAVIFLAHDEHNYTECADCTGVLQCPACRKIIQEKERLSSEIEAAQDLLAEFFASKEIAGTFDEQIEAAESDRAAYSKEENATLTKNQRIITRRSAKIKILDDKLPTCSDCYGHGTYSGGTGGTVICDGEEMDYRTYNYWLHQPKKWTPAGKEISATMCEQCGGTGRLPEGKVFGCLLPSDIEYIMKDEGDGAAAEAEGIATISPVKLAAELPRKCGTRRPGGYYVRSGVKAGRAGATKAMVAKLVAEGIVKPEEVDVIGTFIRFLSPVEIPGVKRFRGLKTWSLDPAAEDEVEMAVAALAAA